MFNTKALLITISLFVSLLFGVNANAKALKSIRVGPSIGSQVPEIMAIDQQNQPVKLADFYGEKGVVVVFFRSADWCPFCKRHLVELNQIVPQIEQAGYKMVGISYDSVETLNTFSKSMNIAFPLLADQKAKTVRRFKVLNKDYKLGDKHYGIPYPGVMVISPDGELKDKYFYKGYKKRITAESLLEKLN
ncbi:peroxiredoxin family protein [Aliikangiella sp. G2MR2-5]|uniref:peroxiredoxin family protein n=1 Tax=Aliikangiella sp. G2MR2-5 TaxID=2788943 RepID=UPI0018A9FF47|nr:peroxiredoxin family protein [Aliikangiella sp. G2MR2-5]